MEEENTKYEGVFLQFPNLDYVKLREKACRQIIHIISQSRLGQKMSFSCFGTLKASGNTMDIEERTEQFSRKDTMCIIFNIKEEEKYGYDKLFLFMHKVHDACYYDYIVYNTETKKCNGHFYKNPDISAVQDTTLPSNILLTDINISFNRMENAIRHKNTKQEI